MTMVDRYRRSLFVHRLNNPDRPFQLSYPDNVSEGEKISLRCK